MTRIKLDAAAAELLRAANGQVLFCDENGNPLRVLVIQTYPGEPVLSKEERERRLAQPGGMTTPELVEHLKKLRPS